MVVQVMRLNSSEDRGNEHRINGGPRPNYHYQSYEPSVVVWVVVVHYYHGECAGVVVVVHFGWLV